MFNPLSFVSYFLVLLFDKLEANFLEQSANVTAPSPLQPKTITVDVKYPPEVK